LNYVQYNYEHRSISFCWREEPMARRQDHTPDELRRLILDAAEKIISANGLAALTARGVGREIGYAPGTIYNFFADMDGLILAVNDVTLQRLQEYCLTRLHGVRPGLARVQRLAHAYLEFAQWHESTWRALFATNGKTTQKLPPECRQHLTDLFRLIETTLRESLAMPPAEAARSARLLWASLHGITALERDGRLALVDAPPGRVLADDLLKKYLAAYLA
jgi:AcrR family transcriptional regulator